MGDSPKSSRNRRIMIYLIAVLLLAAGYPLLQEHLGSEWLYFFAVAFALLAARHIANQKRP